MQQTSVRKRFGLLMITVLACSGVFGQSADAGVLVGTMNADRILFLGNSLTFCSPSPECGWFGNWGMAATTPENDYAHRVTTAIAAISGDKSPAMQAVNVVNYGGFEQNYAGYDVQTQLRTLLDWRPNILVVELGDNVTPSLTSQQAVDAFADSLDNLLDAFKANGNPRIFMTSTWWPNAATDDVLQNACSHAGGVFIDIGKIGQNPLNVAVSMGIYANTGVAAHPSEQGMQAIADAVTGAMVANAIPEPGIGVMLATTALIAGGHALVRAKINRKCERR